MKKTKSAIGKIKALKISIFTLFISFSLSSFAQIKRADRFYYNSDFGRAALLYKKAIKKDKQLQYSYTRLGNSYFNLKMYDLSENAYYRASQMGPSVDGDFYLNYGISLMNVGKYRESKKIFQKYLKNNSQDPRAELYLKVCDMSNELSRLESSFDIYNLTINTEYSDFSPVFNGDGIVFVSSRKTSKIVQHEGGIDLFYAREDSNKWSFNLAQAFFQNSVNKLFNDGPATFSVDKNVVYFSRSSRKSGMRGKIFSSKFENGSWKDIQPFFLNSDSFSVSHPCLSQDGKRLYFVSDKPGGLGATDIYYCEWQEFKWGEPINLGSSVNTFAKEMFPYIDTEGNLFFSSEGYSGYGGLDICVAKKNGNGFNPVHVLRDPINSSADDFGIIVYEEGKEGYFSSNRSGGKGSDDIYYFKLKPVELESLEASTYVIPQYIIDGKKQEVTTNGKDSLSVAFDRSDNKNLIVNVNVNTSAKVSTGNINAGDRESAGNADKVNLNLCLIDATTKTFIESGSLWVYNSETGNVDEVELRNSKADYLAPKNSKLFIKAFSEGYGVDCISVAAIEGSNNCIALNKTKQQSLISNSIYYDKNQHALRQDAFPELNYIADIMKSNKNMSLEIASHTDSKGTSEHNQWLSVMRSRSAKDYLTSKGIDEQRMKAKGYGEKFITNHCKEGIECSEMEHQFNRRTEFKFKGIPDNGIVASSLIKSKIRDSFKDKLTAGDCSALKEMNIAPAELAKNETELKAEQARLKKEEDKKIKVEEERLKKEQAEQLKVEKLKMQKEHDETIRIEKERLKKEKEEKLKLEKVQLQKEKEERLRIEKEKLQKENDEKVHLETEKLKKEQEEKLQLETERLRKVQDEKVKLEAVKLKKKEEEKAHMEAEKIRKQEEKVRLENEKLKKEQEKKVKLEEELRKKEEELKAHQEAVVKEKAEREAALIAKREATEKEKAAKEQMRKQAEEKNRMEDEVRAKKEKEELEKLLTLTSGESVYSVLLSSSSTNVETIYSNLDNVFKIRQGKTTSYFVGQFKDEESAQNMKNEIVKKGFAKASVIKLNAEGLMKENSIATDSPSKITDVKIALGDTIYTVQIASSLTKYESKMNNMNVEDLFKLRVEDHVYYLVGKFQKYNEALNKRMELLEKGFTGAFVVKATENQRIIIR